MSLATPKLLNVSTTVDNTCDANGIHRFTIRSATKPTLDQLADIDIHGRHCHCTHDCCGHIQLGSPWVVRRTKRNEWLVEQRFYCNV